MKTYTKTHSNKKAADAHLAAIKKRGGTAKAVPTANGTKIEYSFPEKTATKKPAAKKSKAKTKVAKEQKRYDVISPDGFTIRMGVPEFKTEEAREKYFEMWKNRYVQQGYYSSNMGRIPLNELRSRCSWIEL